MQSAGKLARNVQGRSIADTRGCADFNQAGYGILGNPEGRRVRDGSSAPAPDACRRQPRGDRRGWDRGWRRRVQPRQGQRCGWGHIVDAWFRCQLSRARIGCGFAAFSFSVNPETQKRCYSQSIQPGGHIIEDDAPAVRQAAPAGATGKGLVMSNRRKRSSAMSAVSPVGGAAQQRDPLAGDFIDDDELRDRGGRFRGRQWWRRERRR